MICCKICQSGKKREVQLAGSQETDPSDAITPHTNACFKPVARKMPPYEYRPGRTVKDVCGHFSHIRKARFTCRSGKCKRRKP